MVENVEWTFIFRTHHRFRNIRKLYLCKAKVMMDDKNREVNSRNFCEIQGKMCQV